MIPREKNSRGSNNVTNLDEVRQAKHLAQSAESNNIDAAEKATTAVAEDDAMASTKAKGSHGNRRFDAKKVAQIKAAIAAGEYTIDPTRIADKFIEHDRNQ